MAEPLISVLLPVYNAAPFIREAIQSVLAQTEPRFELIVIDDGSKDDSAAIIESIKDPRIRFFRQENKGMGATLNYAIRLAQGKYLARQDADDFSMPSRFSLQLEFMEEEDEYALVGTWAEIVDENTQRTGRAHCPPQIHPELNYELLFDNPFVHSSVMIRRSALEKTGPYDLSKTPLIQDYELWWRIAQQFRISNIPETLVLYREVTSSMSRVSKKYAEIVAKQSEENIRELLKRDGQEMSDNDLKDLREFCLLYHCAFDALPVQPKRKNIAHIANRIETATKHFWTDFNADRSQLHAAHLAKCWRDYRINHPDTSALARFKLRALRKLNSN